MILWCGVKLCAKRIAYNPIKIAVPHLWSSLVVFYEAEHTVRKIVLAVPKSYRLITYSKNFTKLNLKIIKF